MGDYICPVCKGQKYSKHSRTCMACVGLLPAEQEIVKEAMALPNENKCRTCGLGWPSQHIQDANGNWSCKPDPRRRPRRNPPRKEEKLSNPLTPLCPKCGTNEYALTWYDNKIRCIACKEIYANSERYPNTLSNPRPTI